IGKTAIAGYTFVEGTNGNNNEGPENIWDGDTATKFCTGEFPISSTAELDGWYKVDGIVMATANDNAEYNGRLPSAWTVSGSADGENWTVIASGDESFFEEANFRYFAGDASSDAIKYVKFDAEGASSGCFQISELVLTGSKTDAPAVPAAAADEKLDEKAEAPNTFDFGVVAAVAAVISLGGFAVSKKKH
ncbi:MAG: discoidin domain-containing protein, partial [Clostridia bacterium]|nr:discoidin domain-containing protein [Clostridia bacterium]